MVSLKRAPKTFSLTLVCYFALFLVAPSALATAASSDTCVEGSSAFLNFSSPAPYIFSSLNGLLQQWSNTFFPNGHTISACEIPRHTLLYHGRLDADEPPSPEWLAFDMEMSYAIMGSMSTSRLLTYRTIRAVKCLYFDGTSASLMGSGTESQMTFLYGDSDKVPSRPFPGPPGRGRRPHPPPGDGEGDRPGPPPPPAEGPHDPPDDDRPRWNPLEDEYFRARGLCNWIKERGLGGRGWGYEGIVRMNAGFEIIWCDFNSTSLALLSNLDVSAPLLNTTGDDSLRLSSPIGDQTPLGFRGEPSIQDEGPHGPGMTDRREPFREIASYMWFAASAKRYGTNGNVDIGGGETRVKIDTCGLFTFYDSVLTGQNSARIEEERVNLNITKGGYWLGPKSPDDDRASALDELMKRRRSHRANHVTEEDGLRMYELVEGGLRNALNRTSCSTIPWDSVAREITAFYARRLLELRSSIFSQTLDAEASYEETRQQLQRVRHLTHWLMVPFFEYPTGPYTNESLHKNFSRESPAAREGIHRCSTQYMAETDSGLSNSGEACLAGAVREVLASVCSTAFSVGLAVEREWLLNFNMDAKSSSGSGAARSNTRERAIGWLAELEELMAWLGWVDQWTACEERCAANEICYIPMWPVGGFGFGRGGDQFLWEPTCVDIWHYPPKTLHEQGR